MLDFLLEASPCWDRLFYLSKIWLELVGLKASWLLLKVCESHFTIFSELVVLRTDSVHLSLTVSLLKLFVVTISHVEDAFKTNHLPFLIDENSILNLDT